MNAERWERIKPIFHEAAELPADKRADFIRARCVGDETLAVEIESLLGAHEQAGSFIEGLPRDPSDETPDARLPDAMVGRRIGAYEIIREIGRGGMGAVYLASRADDQFRKLVAIKVVKAGFDGESIFRRFRNERQILASLDHPNIARLLDGGTTAEGSPYFVMEYIEGQPIGEYCDSRRLGTFARLNLFRSVCGAVHYAHQNLIVHRDIKPGNILVTTGGNVKLLDFGIAKLLGPSAGLGETAQATQQVMTPDYASPEQARGDAITTVSDIYSLGVLLYELLSGHRPYRLGMTSPLEIVRAICEEEPSRPSTAVVRTETTETADGGAVVTAEAVGRARGLEPERLRRQLEGDLDNIVLKAMRKEPQRRYASVEQFSEDIRRHLAGLPVIARKDTFSYRAGKFMRRNKLGAAVAALVIVLVILGVAGIARQTVIANQQRTRAEKRFNEVRKLANSFMFKFHDSIAQLSGATEARRLVVSESLAYLNSLAEEASDDPELQSELAEAYFRLGDIQGVSTAGNLGDQKGALESHRKALALREAVVTARPNDRRAQVRLATSYMRVGSGYLSVDSRSVGHEVILEHLRKAIDISEALLRSDPADQLARKQLAASYHKLGQYLAEPIAEAEPDPKAALEAYEKAAREREAYLEANPTDRLERRNLSLLYKNLGAQMHMSSDREAALVLYRKALVIDEADSAAAPNDAEVRMALSFSYGSIGSALADMGELPGALDNYRKALDLRLSVAAADPRNAFARSRVASAYERIGGILEKIGDRRGALQHYKEMFRVHESANDLPQQAAACSKIADFYSRLGADASATRPERTASLRDALHWYRRSLDFLSRGPDQTSGAVVKEKERITKEIARSEAAIGNRR